MIGLGVGIQSCVSIKIPESGSRQTTLFYTAATDLRPGARLDMDDLEARLRRLGYRSASDPAEDGQYAVRGSQAVIALRPFRYHDRPFPGGRLRVRVRDGVVASAEAIDGDLDASEFRLEPERIAGFEGETGAFLKPIRLADAPDLLKQAVVAIEDRRFYQHFGIDPIGTARAVVADLRHRKARQGGSTLTQQLARSLYLHNEKTFLRKAREAFIAVALEARYSKDEILEAYLNAVYWGYWGSMEIRGVREASEYYLGKELEDADAAGIALLVGLIQAPNVLSPYNHPEKAKARRDLVLRVLNERGILDEAATKKAQGRPLPSKQPPDRIADAAYFLDAARDEVTRRAGGGILGKGGASVFTTLDPRDQTAAVSALQNGLKQLERDHKKLRRKKDPLQGAVVVLDPVSGAVSALVGGRDHLASPFNRAVDAQRQPGSLFKPFVYLAAFRNPRRKDGTFWNAATVVEDEPLSIRAGRKWWRPQNYDRTFRGPVTVRYALEHSLNVPTASVAHEIGVDRVAEAAHDAGVKSRLAEVPSLSLGTSEVNLLEMVSAYGTFANRGMTAHPTLLEGVLGPDGEDVPLAGLEDPPGIEEPEAYLLTRILQGVIDNGGTGRAARAQGVHGAVAGKTGTTDDYRDAWFIGYTPRRVAGVWVGFDKREVVGLAGGAAALPIWSATMKRIAPDGGDGGWRRPPGIEVVAVCPESGKLANADCPNWREDEFIQGTEPEDECDKHGGGFFDAVKRIFHL